MKRRKLRECKHPLNPTGHYLAFPLKTSNGDMCFVWCGMCGAYRVTGDFRMASDWEQPMWRLTKKEET